MFGGDLTAANVDKTMNGFEEAMVGMSDYVRDKNDKDEKFAEYT